MRYTSAVAGAPASSARRAGRVVRGMGVRPSTAAPGPVSLGVYDLEGRLVRTVADRRWTPAGPAVLALDGRDDRGAPLRRGIYFLALETPAGRRTARFAVLR